MRGAVPVRLPIEPVRRDAAVSQRRGRRQRAVGPRRHVRGDTLVRRREGPVRRELGYRRV